jgi:hypothetical protein
MDQVEGKILLLIRKRWFANLSTSSILGKSDWMTTFPSIENGET